MTIPASVNIMAERPIAEVVELAALAERCGYRRCWAYDEGLATRDVYVTLAAIAARTSSILLGPGITNPYVRHPGATATAIATLDEMSGGRAFLGLGAGGGLTLGPLAVERTRPVAAVRETATALRKLFAGETVTTDPDSPVPFRGARLDYGRAGIEIILAGRGPRMTALGAEIADGFTLSYVHKELVGETVAALRAGAAASRPGRPFLVSYCTLVVTDDAEMEESRRQLSFRLLDSPPRVQKLIGMTEADAAAIREALAAGGPTEAAPLIKEEWVPHFCIVGSPVEAAAELRALMGNHDINEFQVSVLGGTRAAERIERTAALFT